jgi:hypothetical protein
MILHRMKRSKNSISTALAELKHEIGQLEAAALSKRSEQAGTRIDLALSSRSTKLGRLLFLCAELDYFAAILRGNPRHFSLKAVRDVKLDYLCHESVYCFPA